MFTIDHLIAMYARNVHFIKEYTKGLNHADSLAQPPVPGNCMNWVIGHILVYRNRILQIAGQPAAFDAVTAARYTANSKPVLGDEPGIGIFEDMLHTLDESQELIAAAMKSMSPDDARQAVGVRPAQHERRRVDALSAAARGLSHRQPGAAARNRTGEARNIARQLLCRPAAHIIALIADPKPSSMKSGAASQTQSSGFVACANM